MIHGISLEAVEYAAHWLAVETMSWNEPIPAFSTRSANILESCINQPFQKFNRRYLYTGLIGKAAILFYLMIKNHPFQNGNKRLAVTTLLVFLHLNAKWLKVDTQQLYRFALWVADSDAALKNEVVQAIEKFLKLHVIEVKITPTN